MTPPQIVTHLLDAHKAQGVDLSYLLDNPVFLKLSLPDQLAAIKRHARDIHDGVHLAPSGSEFAQAGVATALSGLRGGLAGLGIGAGMQAAGWGMTPQRGAAIGAIMAGIGSAMSQGLNATSGIADRRLTKSLARRVAENPSDETALDFLNIRGLRRLTSQPRNRILDHIGQLMQGSMESNIPSALHQIGTPPGP